MEKPRPNRKPEKERRGRAKAALVLLRPADPPPEPEKPNGISPLPQTRILEEITIRSASGEERKLDHRHFADYLSRVPVNEPPGRLPLRAAIEKFKRLWRQDLAETKARWLP